MSGVRFIQLDVFTAVAGGGNPLGVVIGADDWPSHEMQRFAAWTNLVETTWLLPPRSPEASYRLRIFTPTREIAFAGHPTIGSAHAALDSGYASAGDDGRLLQDCDAGLLPIVVEGSGSERILLVQAPRVRILARGLDADPQLAELLRSRRLGRLPPAFVEGGRRWWLAELADENEVRGWHPNHAAIAALAHASDSLGLCVFARCQARISHPSPAVAADPRALTRSAPAGRLDVVSATPSPSIGPLPAPRHGLDALATEPREKYGLARDYDLVVRAFPAGVGIVEDPASGAANGLVAAYIADSEPQGPLGRGYRVSQGREIGHDASILIRIDGGDVWVGGQTRTVITGTVAWP